jgi:hypothetical protein
VKKYTFICTVEVPDDHEAADDPEWWSDAAWGALSECGATTTAYFAQPRQKLITLPNGAQVFLHTTDDDPTIKVRAGVVDSWTLELPNELKPHQPGTVYTGEW